MSMPTGRKWLGPEFYLIALFVIFSTALFYANYTIGRSIDVNGVSVQVAGRQRLMATRLPRWLLELRENPGDPGVLGELKKDFDGFNTILEAFARGGQAEMQPGVVFDIKPTDLPAAARQTVLTLEQVWTPINTSLAALLATDNAAPEAVDRARTLLRQNERGLLGLQSKLIGEISVDSFAVAGRLRTVQMIGAVIAVTFFFFLIYLFSRQLRVAREAKKETDEILQTVPSGLFLLDRNYLFGEQHSAQLEQILGRSDLKGQNFFEMLKAMIPEGSVETARNYLGLLFSDRVVESLVVYLNPLDKVEVQIRGETGRMEKRFLGFSFRRVLDGLTLKHLLVSVTDNTDRVMLGQELERIKADADQQTERTLEMIQSLMQVEPRILKERLRKWEGFIMQTNEALKRSGRTQSEFSDLINQVFRPMHSLKGEAAALNLSFLAQRAGAIERELAELRTRSELTGNDFLPVTVRLEELFAQFHTVRGLVNRLVSLPASSQMPSVAAAHTQLEDIASEIARKAGRMVKLTRVGIKDSEIPSHLKGAVQDILLQMVRNSVAHGIETPSERVKARKPETGQLKAELKLLPNNHLELTFRDDGRGIDFAKVRARAVKMGRVTLDQAEKLEAKQLIGYLFEPGFSTSDEVTDLAGRGVGLDIVREHLKRYNGRVSLATGANEHTLFRFTFPAA